MDQKIICVAEDCGKTHDFKLYKNTIGSHVLNSIKEQADSGYQGISAYHQNVKRLRKNPKAVNCNLMKKGRTNVFLVSVFLLRISMQKLKYLKS